MKYRSPISSPKRRKCPVKSPRKQMKTKAASNLDDFLVKKEDPLDKLLEGQLDMRIKYMQ
jgi:hypothetical protein